MSQAAAILKQQFSQSIGLPWQNILPDSRLEELLEEEAISYRSRVYTPIVTLWAMIHQVLCEDKSLRNTVKSMTSWLVAADIEPPSSDTGAYSRARGRLPEHWLQRLVPESAAAIAAPVPESHHWCGRRVKVYDGTTILMADSAANQAAYPQHGNQAQGCGFPLARLVVFFCLVTGAVVSAAVSAKTTSEIVMSRWLYEDLDVDDVAMADQAYGSYVDLALIQQQGADGMLRKHHARKTDFRTGRKHGIGDHQVTWHKPIRCPDHMSADAFAALPETLQVREVRIKLSRKGFRDRFIVIVTTLLDTQRYSAKQLGRLYSWRWQSAEINLRHLKTTLAMEMLTAKTPKMVRKELWVHLLAYNLLRTLMEKAAPKLDYQRTHLSLQATRQHFRQMLALLATTNIKGRKRLQTHLLEDIVADKLPIRPDRHEPRVVKRRPKPFPRMRQPRDVLKAMMTA